MPIEIISGSAFDWEIVVGTLDDWMKSHGPKRLFGRCSTDGGRSLRCLRSVIHYKVSTEEKGKTRLGFWL